MTVIRFPDGGDESRRVTDRAFTVRPWDGQARSAAFVWRLKKGNHFAVCELWTHPIGAEIRVEAGGEFVRSEAGRDVLALIELSTAWLEQFQQKGWTHS